MGAELDKKDFLKFMFSNKIKYRKKLNNDEKGKKKFIYNGWEELLEFLWSIWENWNELRAYLWWLKWAVEGYYFNVGFNNSLHLL